MHLMLLEDLTTRACTRKFAIGGLFGFLSNARAQLQLCPFLVYRSHGTDIEPFGPISSLEPANCQGSLPFVLKVTLISCT